MKYSIIVPVYNEAENVIPLHKEIVAAMNALGESYEIIFINDGSTDKTRDQLATLSPITIIDFRKNFGQTAALDAGFKHAQGEFIIALDGDGQNPPTEIPKLIKAMKNGGFDVVSGWRQDRHDPVSKHLLSRGANKLRKLFINDGIHDSGCTLKIYKRECFDDIDLFGEMHRFIPGVLRWHGFSIGEVAVAHRQRQYGESKYNSVRVIKGLVDMIGVWFWRKYATRPLHLFGGSGIIFTAIGIVFLAALGLARLFWDFSLSRTIWPLIAVMLILIGFQLFISGLMAEMLVKNYYKNGQRPYKIKKISRL